MVILKRNTVYDFGCQGRETRIHIIVFIGKSQRRTKLATAKLITHKENE